MSKYKCPNSKCSNKQKVNSKGYCPECGTELKKEDNTKLYLLAGGCAVLLILLIVGMAMAVGSLNSHANNTTKTNITQQKTNTNSTPTTSSELDVAAVKSIIGSGSNIKSVDVQNGVVTITYDLGFVNDNDDIILKTSEDSIRYMQKLFKDNRVTSVTVISSGEFTDQYGKDKVEEAVRITITKETANKIDWNGVNNMLSSDKGDLLKISDSYSINPSVYAKLTFYVPISK